MLENRTQADNDFITSLTALIIKAKTPKEASDIAIMVNQMIGDVIEQTKSSIYNELKDITEDNK